MRRHKRGFSAHFLTWDVWGTPSPVPLGLLKIYRVPPMMFIVGTQTLMNGLLNI